MPALRLDGFAGRPFATTCRCSPRTSRGRHFQTPAISFSHGELVFPLSRARDVLALMSESAYGAPDELSLGFTMAKPPGDQPGAVIVDVCYCGEDRDFERAMAPVRKLGQPMADTITKMDHPALHRSGDNSDPRAMGIYLTSDISPRLGTDLITEMIDSFPAHPSRGPAVFFQMSGGAIARVPSSATAVPSRDAMANLLTASQWRFGDDRTPHMSAIRHTGAGSNSSRRVFASTTWSQNIRRRRSARHSAQTQRGWWR